RHSRQTALGWFIHQALDDEEITIFDGRQVRDYTYIDDAIEAFILAGASDAANGEVFNLGGTAPVNLIELVDTLVRAAGSGRYRIVPFPEERRRIDIGDFYADYAKIASALGWRPAITLEDGLARTTAYYRKHWDQYWSRP
ncbi:MAG: GDP-mannose 4,6-dehydratase, partial [Chloroflexota bacterium]